jgi:hypothetical protein
MAEQIRNHGGHRPSLPDAATGALRESSRKSVTWKVMPAQPGCGQGVGTAVAQSLLTNRLIEEVPAMKHMLTSVAAAALVAAISATPAALAAGSDGLELAQTPVVADGEFLPATSWQFATFDELMAQLQLETNPVDAPGETGDPTSQIEYGDLGW